MLILCCVDEWWRSSLMSKLRWITSNHHETQSLLPYLAYIYALPPTPSSYRGFHLPSFRQSQSISWHHELHHLILGLMFNTMSPIMLALGTDFREGEVWWRHFQGWSAALEILLQIECGVARLVRAVIGCEKKLARRRRGRMRPWQTSLRNGRRRCYSDFALEFVSFEWSYSYSILNLLLQSYRPIFLALCGLELISLPRSTCFRAHRCMHAKR